MKQRIRMVVAGWLAVVLLAGPAAAATGGVKVGYWFTTLSSNVRVSTGTVVGTDIDCVSTLGIDQTEGAVPAEAWLRFGDHDQNWLTVDYYSVKYSGSQTIGAALNFDGTTYPVSDNISTTLKTQAYGIRYRRDVIYDEQGRLGLELGLDGMTFDASLSSATANLSEEISAPVPVVGIAGEYTLYPDFFIEAELRGIGANIGGVKASFINADVALRYQFAPNFSGSVAYKYFDMQAEHDDDKADFTIKGPVLLLQADF